MKIAVVGLGAVGGLLAARLARAGCSVSGLARGATLAAVRDRGLRVEEAGRETVARLPVSDDAASLGPQDLVVIALKGPALIAAAESLRPLLGERTIVLPAMNGVPWWFMSTARPTRAKPAIVRWRGTSLAEKGGAADQLTASARSGGQHR